MTFIRHLINIILLCGCAKRPVVCEEKSHFFLLVHIRKKSFSLKNEIGMESSAV